MLVLFLIALAVTLAGIYGVMAEDRPDWVSTVGVYLLFLAALLWIVHVVVGILFTLTPGVQP